MQFEAEFYHNKLRDITKVDKLYAMKEKLDNQVTNPRHELVRTYVDL